MPTSSDASTPLTADLAASIPAGFTTVWSMRFDAEGLEVGSDLDLAA